MGHPDVEKRLPEAIKSAGFGSDQKVRVLGYALVAVEFSPAPDPLALLRFTHALVSEVVTVETIDVIRVAEGIGDQSSVVNRIPMADVNAGLASLTQM